MKYIILFFLITSLNLYSQESKQWYLENYIENDEFNSIIFKDSQNGLMCSKFGGIFGTNTFGSNWNQITSITNISLNSLTYISYNDSYIIVGDSGLLAISSNIGYTWSFPSINTQNNLNSIHSYNNYILVAGNNGTIIKSTNYGSSWNILTTGITEDIKSVKIINNTSAWVVGQNGCVYKTTDMGINWVNYSIPTYESFNSIFFVGNNGWIVSNYGNIYFSNNSGESWIIQKNIDGINLKNVKFTGSSTGWIVGDSSFVLKTTNNGQNWVQIYTGCNCNFSDICSNIYNNILVIGNHKTVIKTTNNFFTTQKYYFPNNIDIYSLSYYSNYNLLAGTEDGRLLISYDKGLNWSDYDFESNQRTTNIIRKIFHNTNNDIYLSQGSRIFKTTDNGLSWNCYIPEYYGTTTFDIYFFDASNGWIVGHSPETDANINPTSILKYTSNGGLNWDSVLIPYYATKRTFNSVYFSSLSVGCLIGRRVIYTSNGGTTWTTTLNEYNQNLLASYFIDNHGWAVGANGVIKTTTNCGLTWSSQISGTSNTLYSVCFKNETEGYIAGVNIILQTTNGGSTWTPMTTPISTTFRSIISNYQLDGFCVGNDMSLLNYRIQQTSLDTQRIILNSGWNMISSYINPVIPNLSSVVDQLGSNFLIAKDGLGNVYWPQWGIDDIGAWDSTKGYQIYVTEADTLTILGTKIIPENIPINLNVGWHLISYLRDSNLQPIFALITIQNNFIIVKDNLGNVYWPDWGIEDIEYMQPGQGYQIYMNQAGTLVYPGN